MCVHIIKQNVRHKVLCMHINEYTILSKVIYQTGRPISTYSFPNLLMLLFVEKVSLASLS